MKTLHRHLLGAILATASGCALPNQGVYTLSPVQAEENRRNTARIEREGDDQDNRNLMQRAAATEIATRHSPTSVSNTAVYAPTNF